MKLYTGAESIYLQVDPEGESACDHIEGVTWCEDRINETDIEYVRVDLVDESKKLKRIAGIIERVDNRCMAADGPVTPTLQEMTQTEMSEIYKLATQGEDS
ncbi:hypothetical protein LCGC14_1394230 [marine sediment metagenome]|uniref:Uncharacterized protein n=1 Tax=marine sediment metagenome TaxID=412755 RepID=A0A0F9JZ21_9ZZZZ